jgi:PAS domain S-box-containing protein
MVDTAPVPGDRPDGAGIADRPAGEGTPPGLFRRAIEVLHDGVLLTDARLPDNPIVFANAAIERITGYARAEVVGRNGRFLQCPETDGAQLAIVRDAIRAGRPCAVELLNRRRDGTRFWNQLSLSPVRDARDDVTHFIGILVDVTDRRTDAAQSGIWHSVFEQSAIGMAHVDPRTDRFVAVNDAFARDRGFTPAELVGAHIATVYPPEWQAELEHQVALATTHGHATFEAEHARKDGSRFPVVVDVVSVEDTEHRSIARIAYVRDMSRRRAADARMRETEAQIGLLLRSARAGIWQWDPDTGEMVWSAEFRALYGMAPDAPATLDGWRRMVHPADAARVEANVERAIRSGIGEWSQEFRLIRPSSEVRWIADHVYVIRDDGKARRLIGFNIDITPRKSAELAVEAARHFAEEVLNNANHGMAVFDRDLRVLTCNRFAEMYFGLTREGAVGQSLFALFPGLEHYRDDMYFDRALQGETFSAKVPRLHLKGTTLVLPPEAATEYAEDPRLVWLLPTYAPHRDHAGEIAGVIVTLIDVSDLKRTQIDLAATNDRLHRLTAHQEQVREEERTRIAREIHDELGSTITSIRMHLQAARSEAHDAGGTLPVQIESIDGLLAAANQSVRRIISDLRPSVLDHLGVWTAIEWYAEQVTAETGLDYEIDISPEVESADIDADRATAIFRIVQEGLNNVLRHANANRLAVRAALEDGTIVLEIRDDGRGYVEHEAGRRNSWGLIGMNERALRFGGHVTVEPARSGGTRLQLRLPLGRRP